MIKNILCSIDGISTYGIASICIFVAVFTAMLFWAFTLKKTELNKMGAIPLDAGEVPAPSTDKIQS